MVNEELHEPCGLAEIPEVTVAPSYVIEIPLSPAPNPAPEIVMELPGPALARLKEIPGITIRADSPTLEAWVTEPEALTLCCPDVDAGTVMEVLHAPCGLAEIPEATWTPS